MFKALKIILAAILIAQASYANAFLDQDEVILNASEAFAISGFKKNNIVDISWSIKNGYYMYKKSFELKIVKLYMLFGSLSLNDFLYM